MQKSTSGQQSWKGQKGQLALEFILLTLVVVTAAGILIRGLVRRDATEPGIVISAWHNIITSIGAVDTHDLEEEKE